MKTVLPLLRYYQSEHRRLDCQVVTPMFLGGADQEAQWRAEPFKALVRYWWRVTCNDLPGEKTSLEEEGRVFGRAGDERESRKSPLEIRLVPGHDTAAVKSPFQKMKIQHPEVDHGGKVDALGYLAGMGLVHYKNGIQHSYFPSTSAFQLLLQYPAALKKEIDAVLALVAVFGTVGARSRNGWGSFNISNPGLEGGQQAALLQSVTKSWTKGFQKDYPNCLGKDEKGPLLWQTEVCTTWEKVMVQLASAYIKVRAEKVGQDEKLDPGAGSFAERHLIGVPLTHHPIGKNKNDRHASPLRFCVRKKMDKYRGHVLHVPHAHSRNQSILKINEQIRTWEKIHRKLDALLKRAKYEECVA